MNGKRAKHFRKLGVVLAAEYPDKTVRQWYRKMKQERKKDRMYA